MKSLTSKDNPLLKKIRLLNSGRHHAPQDPVLAEGIRVLEEATLSGCLIQSAVLSERFPSEARGKALFGKWETLGIPLFQVSEKLFRTLSSLEAPQGAIALFRVPAPPFPPKEDPNALVLYACGIQDPGNLGTLIRTAAASGATLFCTAPGTVSARNPKAIRSSAGAFFHRTPVEHLDPGVFLEYCLKRSIRIYRTDLQDGTLHTETDLKHPSAILLGNEGRGMQAKEFKDLPAIRIPMANGIESLNVAAAGAVLLFEAARQRSCR